MLERDEETVAGATEPLTSIRDADWRHQRVAMMRGYNSLTDYAVDEMLAQLGDLTGRIERLEELLAGELTSVPWPARPEISEDK